jgi:hypothetical protein
MRVAPLTERSFLNPNRDPAAKPKVGEKRAYLRFWSLKKTDLKGRCGPQVTPLPLSSEKAPLDTRLKLPHYTSYDTEHTFCVTERFSVPEARE